MHLLTTLKLQSLLIVGPSLVRAAQISYWVDGSCRTFNDGYDQRDPKLGTKAQFDLAITPLKTNPAGPDPILGDVPWVARNVAEALQHDTLPDYLVKWIKFLFKQDPGPRDSDLRKRLEDIFTTLGWHTEEINDRAASDVRIYCDDDAARWKLVPDDPDDRNPNSERALEEQEWIDTTNWLRSRGAGCNKDSSMWGHTIADSAGLEANAVGEADPRGVISICSHSFWDRPELTDIDPSLVQTTFQALLSYQTDDFTMTREQLQHLGTPAEVVIQTLLSATILHEFLHIPFEPFKMPPEGDDDPNYDVNKAYAFKSLIQMDAQHAVNNPETYLYLAFVILLNSIDRTIDLTYNIPSHPEGLSNGYIV